MSFHWKLLFVSVLALFAGVAYSNVCLSQFNAAASYVFPSSAVTDCQNYQQVSNDSLNFPFHVQVYESRLLFVADQDNNRVLLIELEAETSTSSSSNVIAVFGQTNTKANAGAQVSQSGLSSPTSVYVEQSTGRLWVADYNNNRVIWYNNAATATGGNIAASGVIGQNDFTSSVRATSQGGLASPVWVYVDENNARLWVSDRGNNRALWYNNPTSQASGLAATGVIGTSSTTDFTTGGSFFVSPYAVFIDPLSRLYVADNYNSRVVRYNNALNNVPSIAFGQNDLTGNIGSSSANSLSYPVSIAYDSVNNYVFISDSGNNRIVGYPGASTISASGPTGTIFVGQSASNSSLQGCTATTLNYPYGVFFDNTKQQLYVSDPRNNRVVAYCNSSSIPVNPVTTGGSTGSVSTGSRTTSGSGSTGSRSTSGGASTRSRTTSGVLRTGRRRAASKKN